jgi:hypothetical protein
VQRALKVLSGVAKSHPETTSLVALFDGQNLGEQAPAEMPSAEDGSEAKPTEEHVVRVSNLRARALPSDPRLLHAGRLFSSAHPYVMLLIKDEDADIDQTQVFKTPVVRFASEISWEALGLNWRNAGAVRPAQGREIFSSELAEALTSKTTFTQKEWDGFGLGEVGSEDFIKAEASYFKPEEVFFDIPIPEGSPSNTLCLLIYTHDGIAGDQLLGTCELPVEDLPRGKVGQRSRPQGVRVVNNQRANREIQHARVSLVAERWTREELVRSKDEDAGAGARGEQEEQAEEQEEPAPPVPPPAPPAEDEVYQRQIVS